VSLTVCIFGLGQTGGRLAGDLLRAGAEVYAFDPAPVETPMGAVRAGHPALAATRADVVLAAVPASQAELALLQAIEAIPLRAVYVDASDASPVDKLGLADHARRQEVSFAELSLHGDDDRGIGSESDLSPVPGRLGTVSGPGASILVERLASLGFVVAASDGPVGSIKANHLVHRVARAGIAAFLAEVSATTADPDDRANLLRQLAASIGVGDPNWTGRLVEEAAEPSADLTADALALAAYLDRQGGDSGLTEALARKLPDSPIT
jgi:hypothetical protein